MERKKLLDHKYDRGRSFDRRDKQTTLENSLSGGCCSGHGDTTEEREKAGDLGFAVISESLNLVAGAELFAS